MDENEIRLIPINREMYMELTNYKRPLDFAMLMDRCFDGNEGLKQEEIKEIAGDMYELASHLKETGSPIASEEVLSRRKKLKRWVE